MRIITILCASLYCAVVSSQALAQPNEPATHPFYVGADAGYGSTTWQGLVPVLENQNSALMLSIPTVVNEGGAVWGFFAGYEFGPHFALEANYMRYPGATVHFDETSLYAYEHDGSLDLYTNTDTISLMAKIMLNIPRTRLRAYSSFGVSEIHRWDNMNDTRRDSPTFGIGFIYTISEHIMTELGVNYTAGFGESELNPAMHYVPFLYSGILKLAYRI